MNLQKQLRCVYLHAFTSTLHFTDAVWVALLAARGFTLAQIGLAEGVFHGVSLLCEVPSGMAADLLGRRRTLIFGGALGVVSAATMAFAPSLAFICAGMGLKALGYNLLSGTTEALTYDSLKTAGRERDYIKVDAKASIFMKLASALGALASLLAGVLTSAGYYLADAAVSAVSALAAANLTEPVVTDEQAGRLSLYRQEQIQYTADYIKKTFVDKGMCADWSIHDKGDGNPHVHLLLTMRPFNPDHSWGKKEVKDWDFVRDKSGNIVIDESHPNWWQDKKNPDRHGIRIPVLDENGIQKMGARNRLQWKRVLTDATGWNNPKNCELWRSEWAKVCNEHLPLHNQVDHRSYEKQGKLQIPTIHEGADARKIEQKFLAGQEIKGSWKVAENQIIKQQNTLLQKILDTFGKVSGALSLWKERLNDIRRKPGNYTLNGIHDWANRRTADLNGRNDSGNAEPGHPTLSYAGTESEIAKIKQRVIRAAQHFAKYRGTAFQDGRTENEDRTFGKRKSAMAEIGTEAEQRKQFITETEHRIAELEQQIEKGRDIDERIQRIKERRTVGRTSALDRGDTRRTGTERPAYRGTEDAAQRISDLEREIKQREQSREYSSIKERLEAGRQSIADREREVAKRKRHDRGMSR